MEKSATAKWSGNLKRGRGSLTTESGSLRATPYNYQMRLEDHEGTNPEELVAAAHAGCFTMALAGELEKRGFSADALEVTATATLEEIEKKPTVTGVHLDLTALVPNATHSQVEEAAELMRKECAISRLLNAEITLTTTTVGKTDLTEKTMAP